MVTEAQSPRLIPARILTAIAIAFMLALGITQAACGGESELKRDTSMINPNRCGGSGGGPC